MCRHRFVLLHRVCSCPLYTPTCIPLCKNACCYAESKRLYNRVCSVHKQSVCISLQAWRFKGRSPRPPTVYSRHTHTCLDGHAQALAPYGFKGCWDAVSTQRLLGLHSYVGIRRVSRVVVAPHATLITNGLGDTGSGALQHRALANFQGSSGAWTI